MWILESKDATHLMRSTGIPESRRHEVNPYAIAGDFLLVLQQN